MVSNKYLFDAGVLQSARVPLAINDQNATGRRKPYETTPRSASAKVVKERISSNKAGIVNVFDSISSDARLHGSH